MRCSTTPADQRRCRPDGRRLTPLDVRAACPVESGAAGAASLLPGCHSPSNRGASRHRHDRVPGRRGSAPYVEAFDAGFSSSPTADRRPRDATSCPWRFRQRGYRHLSDPAAPVRIPPDPAGRPRRRRAVPGQRKTRPVPTAGRRRRQRPPSGAAPTVRPSPAAVGGCRSGRSPCLGQAPPLPPMAAQAPEKFPAPVAAAAPLKQPPGAGACRRPRQ